MNVKLEFMSWPEVKENLSKPHVIIIPIGSTEEHGGHLPLNVDAAIATWVSDHAAQKVTGETNIRVMVAPTVVYTSVKPHHRKFPGTLSINVNTFMQTIEDLMDTCLDQGFKNIIALTSHLENNSPLDVAVRRVKERRHEANIFAISTVYGIGFDAKPPASKAGPAGVGHALEGETAYCMVIEPDLVHLDKTIIGSRRVSLSPRYIGVTGTDRSHGVVYCSGVEEDDSGTGGDPRLASREEGEKHLNSMVNDLADIIIQVANLKK
jgi:creatinine amidohydrolase